MNMKYPLLFLSFFIALNITTIKAASAKSIKRPKAESKAPKAESKAPKAESKAPKAESKVSAVAILTSVNVPATFVQAKKEKNTNVFIHDSYTSRRGRPKMLEICCSKCNEHVMSYQKDGPGKLLRCYLDRIHSPKYLQERQYKSFNVKTADSLSCASCSSVIGIPMIYKLEKRAAYNMVRNKSYSG